MTFFPALAPEVTEDGVRFRVLSRAAKTLHLQLEGGRAIALDREKHCRDGVWEVFVPGIGAGQQYTWAVDPERPLLDPCALAFSGPGRFGAKERAPFRSVVVAPPPTVDWERPRHAWGESVLYELHVRGATRHPSSGARVPGTFRGLTERIPYLQDLGVTAVELLPVQEFDETEGLFNFWGYSPIGWLAPNRRYAESDPVGEFREMVLAFHRAKIEVIVDVVFNHTAERGATGPTWHFRGLDDQLFYLHGPATGAYLDLTGCGNTVNAQHPAVRPLILDALRWWVHGLGVDGFRFDLAPILARDERGHLMERPPLVREIEEDPLLEGTHLIAEAWDAADGYLVGRWPGGTRWHVWNDRFRDDVRRAWLLDPHFAGALASRLSGSSDLFDEGPLRGVNYVTCHDGLTLRDVVSYSRKHNEANGEGGKDGMPNEVCANHGAEGPTRNRLIATARERARRNLMASLLLAQGVPMLLAGDEIGRTQKGNNNAYCHDNELTWIDWSGLGTDVAFHRFVKGLIALRRECPALRRGRFLEDKDVSWIGPDGGHVDWEKDPGHFGYVLRGEPDLLVLVNLIEEGRSYRLPDGDWHLVADTAAPPPADLHEPAQAWTEKTFRAKGKSLAVFRGPA